MHDSYPDDTGPHNDGAWQQQNNLEDHQAAVARVEQALQASAPELLDARLPRDLEDRLLGATVPDGFTAYALGIHQAGAYTIEQATEESAATPVTLNGQSISAHFVLVSPEDGQDMIRKVVTQGHYGLAFGKYVYAFPVEQHEVDEHGGIARRPVAMSTYSEGDPRSPTDLLVTGNEKEYVNPKYCAGFIDADGQFHENTSFMLSPVLTANDYTAEQVVA